MNKKGQVTLFIIIAVVVVVVIVLAIYFQRTGIRKISSVDIASIKNYFDDCIKLKAEEGIFFIAKQGGYYELRNAKVANFLGEKTVYYYANNSSLNPPIEIVEHELANYIKDNDDCIKKFQTLGSFPAYSITQQECAIKTEILPNLTKIVSCPILIKQNNNKESIEISPITSFTIHKLVNVSDDIIKEYAKFPSNICFECLDEIATKNNLNITIIPITEKVYNESMAWFFVKDNSQIYNNKTLTLRFAVEV